jgi:hypothetical protein
MTDPMRMFSFAGQSAGGLFWALMLLVIWVISFSITKNFRNETAFLFACMFTALAGLPLVIMGLISYYYIMGLLLLSAIAYFMK